MQTKHWGCTTVLCIMHLCCQHLVICHHLQFEKFRSHENVEYISSNVASSSKGQSQVSKNKWHSTFERHNWQCVCIFLFESWTDENTHTFEIKNTKQHLILWTLCSFRKNTPKKGNVKWWIKAIWFLDVYSLHQIVKHSFRIKHNKIWSLCLNTYFACTTVLSSAQIRISKKKKTIAYETKIDQITLNLIADWNDEQILWTRYGYHAISLNISEHRTFVEIFWERIHLWNIFTVHLKWSYQNFLEILHYILHIVYFWCCHYIE